MNFWKSILCTSLLASCSAFASNATPSQSVVPSLQARALAPAASSEAPQHQSPLLASVLYQEKLLWGALYQQAAMRHQGVLLREELFSPTNLSNYNLNPIDLTCLSKEGDRLCTFNPVSGLLSVTSLDGQEIFSKRLSLPKDKNIIEIIFFDEKVFFQVSTVLGKDSFGEGFLWVLDLKTGHEKKALDPAKYHLSQSFRGIDNLFVVAGCAYFEGTSSQSVLGSLQHLLRYNTERQGFDHVRTFKAHMGSNFAFNKNGELASCLSCINNTSQLIDLRNDREVIRFSLTPEQEKHTKIYNFAPLSGENFSQNLNPEALILMDRTNTNYRVPLLQTYGRWGSTTTPLLTENEMDTLTGDVKNILFASDAGPLRVAAYSVKGLNEKWVVRDPQDPGCHFIQYLENYANSQNLGELECVSFVTPSEKKSRAIVAFSRPEKTPTYHLFDVNFSPKSGEKIIRLIGHHEVRVPRQDLEDRLSPMQKFTYRSFDDLEIPAYLTLPRGRTLNDGGSLIPLINEIHGGPHAREKWVFNESAQFWASRGVGYFMPQFRGSTGFGTAFLEAGDHHWDQCVRDTHEGVQHLLATGGVFDPKRVAVTGCSFGGYGAAFSLLSYPDTYTCGVALNGLYDLPFDLERAKHSSNKLCFDSMKQMGGDPQNPEERALMEKKSPVQMASSRTSMPPLLLVHAEQDTVCVYEHALRLVQALPKTARVTFVKIPKEEHQLNTETTRGFMALSEHFLGEHLGTPVQSGVRHEVGNLQAAGKLEFVSGEDYLSRLN